VTVTARAQERLGRPELAGLVDELERRFGDGDVPASIAMRDLPGSARRALADLLGSDRLPRVDARVRIDRLLDALALSSVAELKDAVEALRGPMPDRRAQRVAERSARESLWQWLEGEAALLALPAGRPLAGWVERQRLAGARGGLEVHRRRLQRALAVLRALPADGLPLAALAADHAGDPHALDHGRSVAAIVLDAVATATGSARPADAEGARLLWETVGVVPDPLSSTVLSLGLPGGAATPLDRWLAAAAGASEPVVLSLANLRRWPLPALPAGAAVFVFENPSLIAAATAGGWSGPPLVCSSGRPSVAVVTLLRQLGAGGASLYQHADFDPTGLAITGWLAERAGTVPWRMTGGDYLGALAASVSPATLSDPPPATPWDPALAGALEHHGVAVFEEAIRHSLLEEAAESLLGPGPGHYRSEPEHSSPPAAVQGR